MRWIVQWWISEKAGKTVSVKRISLRNRNPLNGKWGNEWRGWVGRDDQGHAIFKSATYGYRAGAKDIMGKFRRGRVSTLHQLMCLWAEANCDKYAAFVAERVGYDVDQRLTVADVDAVLPQLLAAIANWENGGEQYVDYAAIERGIASA